MYRRFVSVNTGNGINIFDAGGLKVMRAMPEKHLINFFGLINQLSCYMVLPAVYKSWVPFINA